MLILLAAFINTSPRIKMAIPRDPPNYHPFFFFNPKVPITTAADDSLEYFFIIVFSEKIRLNIHVP